MSLPRYPEYKASGVEWLGDVPGHWKMRSLRYAATIQNGSDFKDCEVAEGGYPVLGSGGEFARISKFIYDQPSVLLGRKGTIDNPLYIEEPFWTVDTLFYTKIAADTYPKFFYWFCTSIPFDYFQFGSAVPSMTQNDLYGIKLPTPSFTEQQTIAAFLDRETGKIDALIAEQRRLVELLAEKRQAVISHAVTKGLPSTGSGLNAPMKDSGIAWLGEVPAHWRVKRLKFVASVQTGIAKGKDNAGKDTISVPYLRVANVQDGYLDLEDVATIDIPLESLERYRLQSGDVLMNEGGDFDKLGRGHVWRCEVDPCIHQNHVFAVRPHSISSDWLNLVTGTNYAQFYFMTRSKQSTNLASISSTNVMELPIICPPDEEQSAIATFLDTETEKFDALTAEANRAIALLQERRSALISAAVTGKIDVRGV